MYFSENMLYDHITNKTWPWGQYASLRTDWSDWGRFMARSAAEGHIPYQSVNLHFARKTMFYLLYYTESTSKSFHPFCCCHFYYNLLLNNNLFVQCVKYFSNPSRNFYYYFQAIQQKHLRSSFVIQFLLITLNRQKKRTFRFSQTV
jgi:hypothetical protein